MSAPNLVIVESPAKAKTINKYLGPDYEVVASYGHVRDLPPKDGSVEPDNDFAMSWQLGERAAKPMSEIKKLAKKATTIFLATDPDREGEAISWHVKEMLSDDKLLVGKSVRRVTFNEITKKAVQDAFANARDLDQHLIEAYLARRALDYLVGFNISPVLWRKLPGSRSAGRVQSVALRLICERESEIEKFNAQEYWSLVAKLATPKGEPFIARLTHLAGNKLDKLDLNNEDAARKAEARIRNKDLKVVKVEKKQVRRHPYPPFITSSLQMDASRRLRFAASQTMRVAQRLYEGVEIGGETIGLITYMRTDGT
ncbi:MAG: DNA topoisomerase I, partial [Alphaproteobacteria bacterium]|nr:DNA topoisomerase I [Alphaproteobacteria bacterium]